MIDVISAAAAMSNEEITERLDRFFRLNGRRRRARSSCTSARSPPPSVPRRWGDVDGGLGDGALRGLDAHGPALTRLGEKAWDLPHLVGSLCAGDVSLDKVRAVADVATPESDQELCAQAKECTVRELADVARTSATPRHVDLDGALGARPPLPALQRGVSHHERAAAR